MIAINTQELASIQLTLQQPRFVTRILMFLPQKNFIINIHIQNNINIGNNVNNIHSNQPSDKPNQQFQLLQENQQP